MKEYFNEEELISLKENNDLLYKTLELILKVFEGSLDKGGLPYYNHLFKVYSKVSSYDEKIVALLHDIVEDKKVTKEDLLELNYPQHIIDAVVILTKKKGAYYPDYIESIIESDNKLAMNVKLADLEHNMDLTRISNPTVNDYERVNKRYMPAYTRIKNKLEELN
jgi:(p)ppGpp synthase/HD superfamily hydrolase